MKRLVVMIWIMLSAVSFGFAQENDSTEMAQRLKTLESQYKLLEDSYKKQLEDMNTKFNLKSQELDLKNRQIEEYRKNLDDRFDIGTKNIEVRVNKAEGQVALALSFLGLGTVAAIWGLIINLRNYAEKKSKEMFDARFAEEFEKLFKASEHVIREIIKSEDETNQLKLSKSIQVLSLPGASENLQDFFLKTGFLNVSYDAFDPNNIIANRDLILLNNDGIKIDLQNPRDIQILTDVGEYISKLPRTTIGFYFGQGIVKYPGDNFASANIRFQLYGNLINALRYQEVLKA